LKKTGHSADKVRYRSIPVKRASWGLEMPSLEHLVYASVATQSFAASQLDELLQKARTANERAGLTGMLLHVDSDGSFFQVLEGEPQAIDRLFNEISRDKRHSHLTTIIREPIVKRSFEAWTMGFSSVSPEKLRGAPGLNDFFKGGSCFAELDAGRAKKLLAAFAEGRWRAKLLGAKCTVA
jgi:Sensors of blue-light using FAD